MRTMRWVLTAGIVALCALSGGADAAERWARCKLVVSGKTYIDGRCNFESFGSDGSFAIGVLRDNQRIPAKGFYFAYVNVDGAAAGAKWNGDPKETHANASLGTLTRHGACWENAIAQICAW